MVSYIKGILATVTEDSVIVENQNIGYEIRIPLSVQNELPVIGSEILIFTYLYVREDIFCLYGFLRKDDLQIFKLLITVNGIGPKGALGILSAITPDNLRFAILAGDTKTIAKAPGIGAKTAAKLILELKDKLNLKDLLQPEQKQSSRIQNQTNQAMNDAIEALTALGYSGTDAIKAVRSITMTDEMDTETILKLSLKKISL